MKFLLVAPKYVDRYGMPRTFPLGLAYISAILKREGHAVHCVDLNFEPEPPVTVVERLVQEHAPDVVGMGSVSTYIQQVKAVFEAARRVRPSVLNIVGNTVFSVDPETALHHLDVDIGVSGEGERAILDVVQALEQGRDLAQIKGIGFRDRNGRRVITARRDTDFKIDDLPWPDYEGFGLERTFNFYKNWQFSDGVVQRKRPAQMITSRSCAFGCTFCFHPLGARRERKFDDIFRELDFLIANYGVNYIAILDELFAFKRERVLEFCQRIRPYNMDWEVSLHSSIADEEVIAALRDARCISIGYGVESASNAVLTSMRKHTTIDVIGKALELTYQNNIEILANCIFGDPAETVETANETLDWWSRHRHYQLSLFGLAVYPGTWIHKEGIRRGIIDRVDSIINIRPMPNLTEMSDLTLDTMRSKLHTFRETLLRPAPVTWIKPHPEPHPLWGELVDIGWRCLRCGKDNTIFDEAKYFDISRIHKLRVTCHHCQTRWDIRNPCNVRLQDSTVEQTYAQGMAQLEQQQFGEALRSFESNLMRASWHAPSAFESGKLLRRMGNINGSLARLGMALQNDPFNPAYMLMYGDALRDEGSPGAARLYYEQVAAFFPDNAEARIKLNDVLAGPMARLKIFFVEHGKREPRPAAPEPQALAS